RHRRQHADSSQTGPLRRSLRCRRRTALQRAHAGRHARPYPVALFVRHWTPRRIGAWRAIRRSGSGPGMTATLQLDALPDWLASETDSASGAVAVLAGHFAIFSAGGTALE